MLADRISDPFTYMITEDQDTAIQIVKEIAEPLDAIMKLGFKFATSGFTEFLSQVEASKREATAEVHDILLQQEALLAQIQLKHGILTEIEQSVAEIERNHGSLGELKQENRVLEEALAMAEEQQKVMQFAHTRLLKDNEQLGEQVSLARDQNRKLQEGVNETIEQHFSLLEQNRQLEQQVSLAREQDQKLMAQNTLLQQDMQRATEQQMILHSTLRALSGTNSALRAHNEMVRTSINAIMQANNKFQDQIMAIQGEMGTVDEKSADDFQLAQKQQGRTNAPREGSTCQDITHGVASSGTSSSKRTNQSSAVTLTPPSKRHNPSVANDSKPVA